jgi:DNA topoisomerase IA
MQGLADAARSRSEADWLVGINGTRAMTAFNSRDGGFFLDHRGPGADAHPVCRGRA